MKHLNIRVSGKVQGVFFRVEAREKAKSLGLNGFVRNETDGTVYIEAEGEQSSLNKLLLWCATGPSMAVVESINSEFIEELNNFSDFTIT